jgi:hypothetical protein
MTRFGGLSGPTVGSQARLMRRVAGSIPALATRVELHGRGVVRREQ